MGQRPGVDQHLTVQTLSFICVITRALNSSSPTASSRAGVKEPSGVFMRLHDVDEHHRSLAEQLDQPVGGAFRGGLGDLGGVLHPDRAGADQEEPQREGRERTTARQLVAKVSPTRPGMARAIPSSR